MNDELRTRHLENVTDDSACALYDGLCAQYQAQYGAIAESAQHIIGDIATMEQTKRALNLDVATRGVNELFVNGRQKFWRENKSIQASRALAEQQRKLMNELKLTPASQRVSMEPAEDDFTEF